MHILSLCVVVTVCHLSERIFLAIGGKEQSLPLLLGLLGQLQVGRGVVELWGLNWLLLNRGQRVLIQGVHPMRPHSISPNLAMLVRTFLESLG